MSCTRGLLLFVLLLLHLAKYSPQYVCRSRPAPAPAPSLCPRCLLLSGPPAPAPVTASSSQQPLTSESLTSVNLSDNIVNIKNPNI